MRVTETKNTYCMHCSKMIKKGTEFHRVYASGISLAWAGLHRRRVVPIMQTKDVHVGCFYRLSEPITDTIRRLSSDINTPSSGQN